METLTIQTPFTIDSLKVLRAGQRVHLSGRIYTARDAAHKRMCTLLEEERELPFPIEGSCIYYTGPSPAPPGKVIGACGPTTSSRMDFYTPQLLEKGMLGMIGKGERDPDVVQHMCRYGAVYFAATGGAGALLAQCVQRMEIIAFADLGCEAVHALDVKDMPLIVAIDVLGNSVFDRTDA